MQVAVCIKPNSKHRAEVAVNDDGSLMVYVKQPAVEGRANQAIIGLVAKHLGVTKSQISIVRGHASKNKLVKILK